MSTDTLKEKSAKSRNKRNSKTIIPKDYKIDNTPQTVEEARKAKKNDIAVIDFEGFVDGVAFDGGKAEKYELTLGSGSFIPGFEEQIVGHSIGEEFDVNVTFPKEYHAENLKGKDAVFTVTLHEIKEKKNPELTDEFVKEKTGSESVEAYRVSVKERLEKANAQRAEREIEDNIIKAIEEGITIPIF